MNKNFKELIESFVTIGIVIIITGIVFRLLHRPNSEVYNTIGTVFTVVLMVGAFAEIIHSKTMSNFSKAVWAVFLIAFKPVALLVYLFERQQAKKKSELIREQV